MLDWLTGRNYCRGDISDLRAEISPKISPVGPRHTLTTLISWRFIVRDQWVEGTEAELVILCMMMIMVRMMSRIMSSPHVLMTRAYPHRIHWGTEAGVFDEGLVFIPRDSPGRKGGHGRAWPGMAPLSQARHMGCDEGTSKTSENDPREASRVDEPCTHGEDSAFGPSTLPAAPPPPLSLPLHVAPTAAAIASPCCLGCMMLRARTHALTTTTSQEAQDRMTNALRGPMRYLRACRPRGWTRGCPRVAEAAVCPCRRAIWSRGWCDARWWSQASDAMRPSCGFGRRGDCAHGIHEIRQESLLYLSLPKT